ncbi:MAG: IreB family regulatory phosphoprotein [Lachnospiraceae bacterium]|nr:IreB family regulatory phosphoprotein [Lachnospiraceae bacterium]
MEDFGSTQFFQVDTDSSSVKEILHEVCDAMNDKGYNPVNQIVGYIMSGDPTYVTSHMGARSKIMKLERDEIVEEMLNEYIKNNHWNVEQ